MKRVLAALLLLSATSFSFSQSENIYDLIPFKKGNKWGLVHYKSGKWFCEAKFDTIAFSNISGAGYSVFEPLEGGGALAKVVLNKQRMWLHPDKSTTTGYYYLEGFEEENSNSLRDESLRDQSIPPPDVVPPVVWEEAKQSPVNNQAPQYIDQFNSSIGLIRVKVALADDSFRLYLNDEPIRELACNAYAKVEPDSRFPVNYLTIQKGNQFALYNLSLKKFATPFEYSYLYWGRLPEVLYGFKNKLCGAMDLDGNILIPFNYDLITEGWLLHDSDRLFVAEKNKTRFFLTLKNKKVITSGKVYAALSSVLAYDQLLFIAVDDKGRFGVVDRKDSIHIPFKYEEISNKDTRWRYEGSQFFYLHSFTGLNGFVDSKNKNFNVEPIYQELNPAMPMNIDGKKEISVFLFAVRKNDKFFYIDQKGKEFYSK